MEKIKLNPTSHSNTKNQFQDTDLNVYTKTIKLIVVRTARAHHLPHSFLSVLNTDWTDTFQSNPVPSCWTSVTGAAFPTLRWEQSSL